MKKYESIIFSCRSFSLFCVRPFLYYFHLLPLKTLMVDVRSSMNEREISLIEQLHDHSLYCEITILIYCRALFFFHATPSLVFWVATKNPFGFFELLNYNLLRRLDMKRKETALHPKSSTRRRKLFVETQVDKSRIVFVFFSLSFDSQFSDYPYLVICQLTEEVSKMYKKYFHNFF